MNEEEDLENYLTILKKSPIAFRIKKIAPLIFKIFEESVKKTMSSNNIKI